MMCPDRRQPGVPNWIHRKPGPLRPQTQHRGTASPKVCVGPVGIRRLDWDRRPWACCPATAGDASLVARHSSPAGLSGSSTSPRNVMLWEPPPQRQVRLKLETSIHLHLEWKAPGCTTVCFWIAPNRWSSGLEGRSRFCLLPPARLNPYRCLAGLRFRDPAPGSRSETTH